MMKVVNRYGNLMDADRGPHGPWTVVTTNGFVKKNGQAVMGRGIARQASHAFPNIALQLGDAITVLGNVPHYLVDGLVTLPVKHHWIETADEELIRRSTIALGKHALDQKIDLVRFPKPGCGNGNLDWNELKIWWLPLAEATFTTFEVWDWRVGS